MAIMTFSRRAHFSKAHDPLHYTTQGVKAYLGPVSRVMKKNLKKHRKRRKKKEKKTTKEMKKEKNRKKKQKKRKSGRRSLFRPIEGHFSVKLSVRTPLHPYGMAYFRAPGLHNHKSFEKSFCSQLSTPELTRSNRKSLFHEFTGELTSKVNPHYLSRSQWLHLPNPTARRRI